MPDGGEEREGLGGEVMLHNILGFLNEVAQAGVKLVGRHERSLAVESQPSASTQPEDGLIRPLRAL